ncbi:hypothetical protein F5Y10DRAFT_45579 [Nemania abortiva]|nr:hypothetical protein F5Y10DRAFT_45579 [Nemania abortiva]
MAGFSDPMVSTTVIVFGVVCLGMIICMRIQSRIRSIQPWGWLGENPAFQIRCAVNKLYKVAERKSYHDYRLDDDTEWWVRFPRHCVTYPLTDQHSPICLASFSRRSEDNGTRRDSEVDLEAGVKPPDNTTTNPTDTSKPTILARLEKFRVVQPEESEILKISQCGHAFHSRCLATWFLKKQYDCPMCRAKYYPPGQPQEQG